MEVAGTIDWDTDEWDAVRCGFQSGFVIGAIAGPLVAASLGLDDLGQSFGWCEVTGDDGFVCDQKSHPRFAALGHGASVKSTLGAVYGHPSGLELSGGLVALGGAVPSVEASLQTPIFGTRGGCDAAECGYFGGVYLSGSGAVCDVAFTDDRLDIFDVSSPETLTLPASFAITVNPASDRAKQDYIAAPYGMKVTVFSASGIYTRQLAPSTLLPAEDESILCRVGTVRDQATGCIEPGWRSGAQRLGPEWSIDPRDEVVVVVDGRGTTLDDALVEGLRIDAMWDAAGQRVTGIRISGQARIAEDEGLANTQDVELVSVMPFGVSATSLAQAIELGFRSGVAETVDVEPAFVPVGASRASFDLDLDQQRLLELAAGG